MHIQTLCNSAEYISYHEYISVFFCWLRKFSNIRWLSVFVCTERRASSTAGGDRTRPPDITENSKGVPEQGGIFSLDQQNNKQTQTTASTRDDHAIPWRSTTCNNNNNNNSNNNNIYCVNNIVSLPLVRSRTDWIKQTVDKEGLRCNHQPSREHSHRRFVRLTKCKLSCQQNELCSMATPEGNSCTGRTTSRSAAELQFIYRCICMNSMISLWYCRNLMALINCGVGEFVSSLKCLGIYIYIYIYIGLGLFIQR